MKANLSDLPSDGRDNEIQPKATRKSGRQDIAPMRSWLAVTASFKFFWPFRTQITGKNQIRIGRGIRKQRNGEECRLAPTLCLSRTPKHKNVPSAIFPIILRLLSLPSLLDPLRSPIALAPSFDIQCNQRFAPGGHGSMRMIESAFPRHVHAFHSRAMEKRELIALNAPEIW